MYLILILLVSGNVSDPVTNNFKSTSLIFHGSSKLLEKRVPTNVEDIVDIMNQYVKIGGLLGCDMDGNKEKIT